MYLNRVLVAGILTLAIGLVGGRVSLAGTWQGTIETIDGVKHLKNPSTAVLPPLQLELDEVWRLGGDTDNEDEFFGVIGDILVDEDNNVYILDSQLTEVRVFDAEGGFLRTVGREGEGPGEFRRPSDMLFLPDGRLGVIQPFPSKIVMLTREGEPAGDFSVEPEEGTGFAALGSANPSGNQLAVTFMLSKPDKGSFTQKAVLALAKPDGDVVAQLEDASSKMDYANSLCVEEEWGRFDRCWTTSGSGHVYARPAFTEYRIKVWKPDGTLDRVIHRQYPDHKRSSAAIERIQRRWAASIARWVKEPTFDIETSWNPINDLFGRDDGSLWVRTSRGMWGLGEGEMARFDVFDADGRYHQEIVLTGEFDPMNDGLFLSGDYIYVVSDLNSARDALWGSSEDEKASEEEPEPMSVTCYRIDYRPLASK